jgi:hypothetical protein
MAAAGSMLGTGSGTLSPAAASIGAEQPWYQQGANWMKEKPFGESGPSRGKLMKQGGQQMMKQPDQQGQGAPAARPMGGGQFRASSNPYALSPEEQQMMMQQAPYGFLGKRYF